MEELDGNTIEVNIALDMTDAVVVALETLPQTGDITECG